MRETFYVFFMDSLRERLQAIFLNSTPLSRKLLVLLVLLVLLLVAVLYSLNSPQPYRIAQTAQVDSQQENSIEITSADFFVHVVGEVIHPGVYPLPSGSRVYDAIFAAGGFTKQAEQSSLNLARPITDGEQLLVLTIGEAQQVLSTDGLISLNTADQAELERLPGVGPVLAARMLDWRASNGAFKSIEDLRKVSGIGPKLFESIKSKAKL